MPEPVRVQPLFGAGEATPITEVQSVDAPRVLTGIGEFDRILGGGAVLGSTVLVCGTPGIGKSTLLLQAADRVAVVG